MLASPQFEKNLAPRFLLTWSPFFQANGQSGGGDFIEVTLGQTNIDSWRFPQTRETLEQFYLEMVGWKTSMFTGGFYWDIA